MPIRTDTRGVPTSGGPVSITGGMFGQSLSTLYSQEQRYFRELDSRDEDKDRGEMRPRDWATRLGPILAEQGPEAAERYRNTLTQLIAEQVMPDYAHGPERASWRAERDQRIRERRTEQANERRLHEAVVRGNIHQLRAFGAAGLERVAVEAPHRYEYVLPQDVAGLSAGQYKPYELEAALRRQIPAQMQALEHERRQAGAPARASEQYQPPTTPEDTGTWVLMSGGLLMNNKTGEVRVPELTDEQRQALREYQEATEPVDRQRPYIVNGRAYQPVYNKDGSIKEMRPLTESPPEYELDRVRQPTEDGRMRDVLRLIVRQGKKVEVKTVTEEIYPQTARPVRFVDEDGNPCILDMRTGEVRPVKAKGNWPGDASKAKLVTSTETAVTGATSVHQALLIVDEKNPDKARFIHLGTFEDGQWVPAAASAESEADVTPPEVEDERAHFPDEDVTTCYRSTRDIKREFAGLMQAAESGDEEAIERAEKLQQVLRKRAGQ